MGWQGKEAASSTTTTTNSLVSFVQGVEGRLAAIAYSRLWNTSLFGLSIYRFVSFLLTGTEKCERQILTGCNSHH